MSIFKFKKGCWIKGLLVGLVSLLLLGPALGGASQAEQVTEFENVLVTGKLTVSGNTELGGGLSVSGIVTVSELITMGPAIMQSRLNLAPRVVPGYLPLLLTFDDSAGGAGTWTWAMHPIPLPPPVIPRPWPPTEASPATAVTFVEQFPKPEGTYVRRMSFEGPTGTVTFNLGNPVPPLGAGSRGAFTVTDLGLQAGGATRLALGLNGTDALLTIGAPSIPLGVGQPFVPGAAGSFTILDLAAPTAPRLAITPAGNLGLANPAPAHRLHIQDLGPGVPADLALDSTGIAPGGNNWVLTSAATGEFQLAQLPPGGAFCAGAPRLEISPPGAAAIGLPAPALPAGSLTVAHSLGVGAPAPAACGDADFAGNAQVRGALNVLQGLQVGGNAGVGGNLQVGGRLQLGVSSWALGTLLDGPDLVLGTVEPPDLSKLKLTVMEFEQATGDVRVNENLEVGRDLRVLGYTDLGDLRARDAEFDYVMVNRDLEVKGVKFFVQPHPTDPTKEITYASLEGPEVGTYLRGEAQLANGEAVIDLPEHFALVTSEEGLTVQLTPVGGWLQLYVVELSPARLVVREAQGKNGRFYYLVQGVRKGYEGFQAVQAKE